MLEASPTKTLPTSPMTESWLCCSKTLDTLLTPEITIERSNIPPPSLLPLKMTLATLSPTVPDPFTDSRDTTRDIMCWLCLSPWADTPNVTEVQRSSNWCSQFLSSSLIKLQYSGAPCHSSDNSKETRIGFIQNLQQN